MNYVKSFNKIFNNQTQQYIKMIIHHNQVGSISWKSIHVKHHINNMKHKKQLIISIDAEKASDKIQHSFMKKILNKVDKEGTHLNIIKDIYEKSTAYIQWWKAESFFSKIWNKTKILTFAILFNIVLEVPATVNRQEKEIKGIQIRRDEVKLSLFADDMY